MSAIQPNASQNSTPRPFLRRRRSPGDWARMPSAAMTSRMPAGPAAAGPRSLKRSVGDVLEESSGMADPWGGDGVEQGDKEVGEHEAHGEDHDAELHDGEGAAEERLHREGAPNG